MAASKFYLQFQIKSIITKFKKGNVYTRIYFLHNPLSRHMEFDTYVHVHCDFNMQQVRRQEWNILNLFLCAGGM